MASLSDLFNRADSTTTLGTGWTTRLNTMGINGNAAYGGDVSVQGFASNDTPLDTDNCQVDIFLGTIQGTGADVYAFLGCNSAGEGVYAYFITGAAPTIRTKATWAGASTVRATASGTITLATADKLSIRRQGNVYTLLQNNVLIAGAAWTDSGVIVPIDSSHRIVGFGDWGGPTNYRRIDSWAANDITASVSANTVTYDSTGTGGMGTTSATWTHTLVGASDYNTLAFVVIAASKTTSTAGTWTVTYGGVAMDASYNAVSGSGFSELRTYILDRPPIGTQTVSISVTGGNYTQVAGNSVVYQGVLANLPDAAIAVADSAAVTSESGGKSAVAFCTDVAPTGPSHTQRFSVGGAVAGTGDFVSLQDTDGSATISVANSAATDLVIAQALPWSPVTILDTATAAITASRSPSLIFSNYAPAENDVVVMFPSSTGTAVTPTAPSGWVNPLGGTTDVESDSHEICCVYHLVTASEASAVTTTYTATNLYGATTTGNVVGCVLRGVDAANVIDSVNSTFSSTNTATPHVLALLTGTNLSNDSLVISCVAADGTLTYGKFTTDFSYYQLASSNTNQGKWLGTYNKRTAAGVDVPAKDITPSGGDEYASITIAFTVSGGVPPPRTDLFFQMF